MVAHASMSRLIASHSVVEKPVSLAGKRTSNLLFCVTTTTAATTTKTAALMMCRRAMEFIFGKSSNKIKSRLIKTLAFSLCLFRLLCAKL